MVSEVCDYVNVMYAGRFVERAPVRSLFETPRHGLQHPRPAAFDPGDAGKGTRTLHDPRLPPNLAREIPGCAFAAAMRDERGESRPCREAA